MILDIIEKKRLKQELTYKELEDAFNGYLIGEVKDYQMSSLLMAICINGMSLQETIDLTNIFIESGDVLDFSDIEGIKVDKHSTGGVGDKTTLVIAPIVASLGIPVIKMSGRGLGYTGGTIDKLESIPGFKTNLEEKELRKEVKDIGMVITSQTASLVPLDRKIYALRDVTGTVESVPLIAASIMSKKIASGADKILIDIKVGKGALVKSLEQANELSSIMKRIGENYHKEVRTIVSNMDTPLGTSIGNSLEVMEAMRILKNEENTYLSKLCIELASQMVSMGKNISIEEATKLVVDSIATGKAYGKFLEFVRYQGGDLNKLKVCEKEHKIYSIKSGIIQKIDALGFGKLSVSLGAGRSKKEDIIDPGVGIVLNRFIGSEVNEGDVLCTIYSNKDINLEKVNSYFEIK